MTLLSRKTYGDDSSGKCVIVPFKVNTTIQRGHIFSTPGNPTHFSTNLIAEVRWDSQEMNIRNRVELTGSFYN